MTPAQKSDADELPAAARRAAAGSLVSSDDQSPEHFKERARTLAANGEMIAAANLLGYAAGILVGERRATARLREAISKRANDTEPGTCAIIALCDLADDIAAGRL